MMKNNKENIEKCIGHDIKFEKINKEELNNPINFVRIDKIYNITNYIKYKFFKNELSIIELENILEKSKKEKNINSLLAYMLYANYYFESENKEKIVKKHKEYEEIILFMEEYAKK